MGVGVDVGSGSANPQSINVLSITFIGFSKFYLKHHCPNNNTIPINNGITIYKTILLSRIFLIHNNTIQITINTKILINNTHDAVIIKPPYTDHC